MTIINDFLRSVGIFFDSLVYGLIGSLYELFMDISATQIFANGTIEEFADRVYALLAIFMLFRLSFSFLTYIITPDAASDKNSGAGKLIGNILLTIVLLISVPWLFNQVLQIQNDLLRDNIIGKIILGTKSTDVTNQMQAGDTMAWETFSAFFYPREDICENGLSDQTACIAALNGNIGGEGKVQVSGMDLGAAYQRIANAQSVRGVSKNGLVNVKDGNGEYIFEYTGFISLIAGGFIAYILLLFSIQIAVRTIKLGVLQLIAPIPIISYLDPKQGKDGMFKKWLKTCGKTFADLFIRLAAIYFAIFVITEITKGGGLQNTLTGVQTTGFAKVLVILGALTFAKDLPKFIEEITGIKLDGGFSLNPFKNNALLGGLVGGALGAGLGAVGGFAGNLIAGNGVKNAFRGFGKGLVSGGIGGAKDKGIKKDTFTRGAKAGVATGTNYANWALTGSTPRGRMAAKLSSGLGAKTAVQKLDDEIKAYEDFTKEADALFSRAGAEMIKYNYDFEDSNNKKIDMNHFKAEKERLNILRNKKIEVNRIAGETDAAYQARLSKAESDHAREVSNLNDWVNKTEKKAQQAYVNEVMDKNSKITDGEITAAIGKMEQIVKENSSYEGFNGVSVVTGADIKKAKDSLSTKRAEVQKSDRYTAAKADQQAVREAKANK